MLNKLLKRCMPWMDKGRWYHVGIKDSSVVKMDPIFDHVVIPEIGDEPVKIYFKTDPNLVVIDAYMTLSDCLPGFAGGFIIDTLNPVKEIMFEDPYTYAAVTHPLEKGNADYWFFIQTLKVR